MDLGWGFPYGMNMALAIAIIIVAVWSVVWKGIALWRSARRKQMVWYIVMLIINTAGILEIIYIFAVSRRKQPAL